TGGKRITRPPGRSSYRLILERLPYFRGSEMGSSIAAPKFPIGGTDYPTGTHRLRSSFIMWRPISRGLWIKTRAVPFRHSTQPQRNIDLNRGVPFPAISSRKSHRDLKWPDSNYRRIRMPEGL